MTGQGSFFEEPWPCIDNGEVQGKIYFLETADQKFIKIGYTTNVDRRWSQLGTLRPSNFSIRFIGCVNGTMDTERRLHRYFAKDRDNGEWFRSSEKLRAFIGSLKFNVPLEMEDELESEPEPLAAVQESSPEAESTQPEMTNEEYFAYLKATCLKCENVWIKRADHRPKQCPRCKSTTWDQRKKYRADR